MKFRYLIILILIISCETKSKENCSLLDGRSLTIYNNRASIKLPQVLFEIKDTLSYSFERDQNLLYICRLFTGDSLSSVFIHVLDNPLDNAGFIQYSEGLERHYKLLLNYDDTSYSYSKFDTLNNKQIFQFIFLSKKDMQNIATGGLIFYVNGARFEILININEKKFKNTRSVAECILNSLIIDTARH